MTRSHSHLTVSAHAAVDVAGGLVMILVPPLASFPLPAAIVTVVLGMLLTGTGLDLATRPRDVLAFHHAFDRLFVLAAAVAALALALTAGGRALAVVFLAAIALVEVAVNAATRYTTTG